MAEPKQQPQPNTNTGAPVVAHRAAKSLVPPPKKKNKRAKKAFRAVVSVFRSFPVFTLRCSCGNVPPPAACVSEGRRSALPCTRVTGTLFGYRKGKVSLGLQDSPNCLPTVVIDLAMQTHVLFRELGSGMVRIALECEKRPVHKKQQHTALIDEPVWTVFCNGKKSGCGTRRYPTDDDLTVMGLLQNVSMGAGVLPGKSESEGPDGELAYMRVGFDHIVGSKDSETLYLISPDGGNNGPDLTIFFVRI